VSRRSTRASTGRVNCHTTSALSRYLSEEERFREQGADIRGVILEYELKREYQNGCRAESRPPDSDGRPDRDPHEIEDWARDHISGTSMTWCIFPTSASKRAPRTRPARGRRVVTEHYRGAHAASVARAGFTCYGCASGSVGVVDADSIHMSPKTSYDETRLDAPLPQRQSAPDLAPSCGSVYGRQARFWSMCSSSPACLSNADRAFTGLAHGQKTHDFLAKLVADGYATRSLPGALHRGRHIHSSSNPSTRLSESRITATGRSLAGAFVERLMLLTRARGPSLRLAGHREGQANVLS